MNAGDTAPDDPITVSASWLRRLYRTVRYTLEEPPETRHIAWLVHDLYERLVKLLRERSELEKRLAERDTELTRLRSENARLRDAGNAFADVVEGWDTSWGPLSRDIQSWRFAAGSVSPDDAPTTTHQEVWRA